MDETITPAQVDVAVQYLRNKIGTAPAVAVILGSGIPRPALDVGAEIPFAEVPHLAPPTVEGHRGVFVFGAAGPARTPVVLVDGRPHYFEGHAGDVVMMPTRICARLGCRRLIVTGAVGALHPGFAPGDIAAIADHINMSGYSPLRGPYDADWGPRFVPPAGAYDEGWREAAHAAAKALRIKLKDAVYVMVAGPNYETAAEAAALARLGGDVVGMSVVPEVLAARQAGMAVFGLAVVVNIAGQPATTHESVLAAAGEAGARAATLIGALLI